MSLLRRFTLSMVLLALLLPVISAAWLTSESAARWLAVELPRWLQPLGVVLELDGVDGSLRRRIGLDGLRLEMDGLSFEAERLEIAWRPLALLVKRIEIDHVAGRGLRIVLPPADPSPTVAEPVNLPELALPLLVRVALVELSSLQVVDADRVHTVDQVGGKLVMGRHGLHLSELLLRMPAANATGFASIAPTAPHEVVGSVAVDVDEQLVGPDIGSLSARIGIVGPALRPSFVTDMVAPTAMRVFGDIDISGVAPRFSLQGGWSELGWPLKGDALAVVEDARFDIAGTMDDYVVNARALLSGEDLPASKFAMRLDGGANSVRITRLDIDTLQGSVDVGGRVAWKPQISWNLELKAQGLNPASLDANWPGSLDAGFTVSGELGDGDPPLPRMQVDINMLQGQLRGYPVAASGDWQLSGDVVSIRGIELLSDRNRIRVDGTIGQRLDARLTVDAPALESLVPGASGALRGEVSVGGSAMAPSIVADLAGSSLGMAGITVESVALDATWDQDLADVNATVAGLDAGGFVLDAVEAKVAGQIDRHRITLDGNGPDGVLSLLADGGLTGSEWRGQLGRLDLEAPTLGGWQLQQAVDLIVGAARTEIGETCLVQDIESVCVEGRWRAPDRVDVKGRAVALELERLAPLLPGDGSVEGLLDAAFEIGGTTAAPVVDATLRPRDGFLRAETDTEPVEIAYRDASVEVRFERDRGRVAINLLLDDDGVTRGVIRIGPDQRQGRTLSGNVRAVFPDLSLVAGFVPALTDISGGFRLDAELSGTTQVPKVMGRMSIDDARALIVPAGIALDEIDLVVAGDGNAPLTVDGRLTSGGGVLRLTGRVGPLVDGSLGLDLGIAGDQFQAVQLPEVSAWITPDIRIRGTEDYRVTGVLKIPRAVVEIDSLPQGAISVSSDEIIVGDAAPTGPRRSNRVSGDVRIELGDDVTFDGFGLKTGLVGAIRARFDRSGNQVDGRIEMRDGEFTAYGQDLEIEQGRLLFAGPPDSPDVDLRAVRVSRDGEVRAYLAMSGPIRTPRPRIYSEPSLPEGEALAYLLTGRGLDRAGSGAGFDIASAAFALGVAQGDPLLQSVGDQIGLDEVRIEAGEDGLESSTLLLGRYLNPDLYVGYVQELFNPEGAVVVRMRLNRNFGVETRSGRTQSVDLFFHHEHD